MTFNRALNHFGEDQFSKPACLIKGNEEEGLLSALRRAEADLARFQVEDSDKDREIYILKANHAVALRQEEEKGYNRGLADGMAMNKEDTR